MHPQAFRCHFHLRPGRRNLILKRDSQALARHFELTARAGDLVFKLDPQRLAGHQEFRPGAFDQVVECDPQALFRHLQYAVQVPAFIEHLIIQMLSVRLEQVILLRLSGRPASAALAALLDDRFHVRDVVAQVHCHVLRFFSPVAPLQLRDPLRDRRPAVRHRAAAGFVDPQRVQAFPGFAAQLQPADRDRHHRLAVLPQPPAGPGSQC